MIASDLVNKVQTGGLDESLNISVQSFALTEPVPEPVDPTGGVRATNQTGLEFILYIWWHLFASFNFNYLMHRLLPVLRFLPRKNLTGLVEKNLL